MEPLMTLIERYVNESQWALESPDNHEANARNARHALELRIAELTGYADALRVMGNPVGYEILSRIVGEVAPDGT